MIPLVGVVSIRRWPKSRSFRLWIPLFVVWILALPLVPLALLVLFPVCLISRVNPFKAIAALWAVFTAFHNTHIEIDNGDALVLVQVL